jgi:dipeptide/tripeptide permease
MRASPGYWLVNVANFGDGVAYFGFLALMTLFMQHDLGFSTGWATTSISLYMGAVTVFMVLGGGVLSDRLGVRRALTLCMVVLLAGRILYVLSPSWGSFPLSAAAACLALLIIAAGEGVIQPALYAGIKEYTDQRTATLGYAFLYAIMNLGIVAGSLASPEIRRWWAERVQGLSISDHPAAGISGAFWFFIGVTAVMLAINILFFTRNVEQRDRLVAAAAAAGPRETGWRSHLRNLPILDRRFLFFIFILLPVRTLFAHQFLTMPDYVTRAFPAAVGSHWEQINMINPAVIVIFVPLIAGLTQKQRVVDMMIAGTAVSAGSTFLLVGEPNLTLLITYMVIFSLGEAMWSSRFLEYVADLAPAGRVGVYMGVAQIPWFLAKATTGFYAGWLLDYYVPAGAPGKPATLWLIYGLVSLCSPLGLMAARRWLLEKGHFKESV